VNEAYEVLRDKERRAAHDQLGQGWQGEQDFQPPAGRAQGFDFPSDSADFAASEHSDFFEALFGTARPRRAHRGRPAAAASLRGQDQHASIVLPLEDSFHGVTDEIAVNAQGPTSPGTPEGQERRLQVVLPKGLRAGQQIRLAGKGLPGLGRGPPGDLSLRASFEPHPLCPPEGPDWVLKLPVAPWEAMLGATVRVHTPEDAVEFSVPPASQTGCRLRLRGRGLPAAPGAPAGDLYAVLPVVWPPAESEPARALYREMARPLPLERRVDLQAQHEA
jgi:curved DNA-binding protein